MKLTHANCRKEEGERNGSTPKAFGRYKELATVAALALPMAAGATTLFNKGDCMRDSLGLKMSVCFSDVSALDKSTALFSISDTLANKSVTKTDVQVTPGTADTFRVNQALVAINVTETAVGTTTAWAKANVTFSLGIMDTTKGMLVELGQCYSDSVVKIYFNDISTENDSVAMFQVKKASNGSIVDALQLKAGQTGTTVVDSITYKVTVDQFAAGATSAVAWVRLTVVKQLPSAVEHGIATGHGPTPFSVYKNGNAYQVRFGKNATHEVELFNVNGARLGVFSGNGTVNVSLEGVSPGIYLLRSKVDGQPVTARLNHF